MTDSIRLFSCTRAIAALLGVLACTAANAETLYQVEILVFKQPGAPVGDEVWQPVDAVKPPATDGAVKATGAIPDTSPLRAAQQALVAAGGYSVLAHQSWTQTAAARASATPVRVQGDNPDNPRELDGSARLYSNRNLYLELDLALEGADPNAGFMERLSAGDKPVQFRLKETRRVSTRETAYFDHPMFGALVRVTPMGDK